MHTYQDNNCPLERLWTKVSERLDYVNMASKADDYMSATDMWVGDIPVQLTRSTSDFILWAKAIKTFNAMDCRKRKKVVLSISVELIEMPEELLERKDEASLAEKKKFVERRKELILETLDLIKNLKNGNWLLKARVDEEESFSIRVTRYPEGY